MLRLLAIALIILCCSCQDAADRDKTKSAPPGNPILKDYVKVPLDKANLADKMNDRHNRQLDKQFKDLE